MLPTSAWPLVLYGGLLLFAGFCLGVGVTMGWAQWRARRWEALGRRQWDEVRERLGSPADGSLRGVRWMPRTGGEDGDA